MNLDNKKIIINDLKVKLSNLIKEAINELPINIKNIKDMIDNHIFFINFIESKNIYEDYKWENMKLFYNKVKKKVNQDKKLYYKIVKIYGIVISYYSIDEYNNYNEVINKLYNTNYNMKIEWEKIKKLHNLLIKKRKNYIKNKNIVKVFNLN
jgi:hypothetical protein